MGMKTKLLFYLLSLPALFLFSSCNKRGEYGKFALPVKSTYIANLNGNNETPANSSTATGTATFKFDPNTNMLSGTISFSGFTTPVTGVFINMGAEGNSGSVVFTVESTGGFTSPIMWNSPALTTKQIDDLVGGNYYVNIVTQGFPNGEIRGQLLRQDTNPPGL